VKVHSTDMAFAAVLAAAGCVAIYAGISRLIRRSIAQRQLIVDRQIDSLTMTVKALQLRVAELASQTTARQIELGAASPPAAIAAGPENTQVKPETLAVLAAAATTFLRKTARVPSARPAAVPDSAGAWAQQGRVIVQTSHNLRPGA